MNTDPKNNNPIPVRAPSQPEPVKTDTNPAVERETPAEASSFGSIVYCYSRKQALADGVQVDVSTTAKEAGFITPVFLTETVFREYVKVAEGVSGQDEEGRLWDILTMLHHACHKSGVGENRLAFQVAVRNSDHKPAELISLVAECGAKDFDDLTPAITVMMPDED